MIAFTAQSQLKNSSFRSKIILVKKDTIQIDSVALNPSKFKVFNTSNQLIPKENYQVNFSKAFLIINAKKYTSIKIEYYRLPNFITKTYSPFNENLILEQRNNSTFYSLKNDSKKNTKLFEGLKN